ncbi:TetR/AcrR family transcriptional regulator [Pseudomonas sp. TE3786]
MNALTQRGGGRVRQNNEALILLAAEASFAEYGFKGASMGIIAQRAGLPKANLHYYFGSKQALYKAVLGRILQLWQDSFERFSAEDEPAEALARYIRDELDFSWRNPIAAKVFALELVSGGACLEALINNDFRDWFAGRAAVFQAWSAAGKMAEVDPLPLTFLLWSSTRHYADFAAQIGGMLRQRNPQGQGMDAVCANLTAIILKGCGVQAASARQRLANPSRFSSNLAANGARLRME